MRHRHQQHLNHGHDRRHRHLHHRRRHHRRVHHHVLQHHFPSSPFPSSSVTIFAIIVTTRRPVSRVRMPNGLLTCLVHESSRKTILERLAGLWLHAGMGLRAGCSGQGRPPPSRRGMVQGAPTLRNLAGSVPCRFCHTPAMRLGRVHGLSEPASASSAEEELTPTSHLPG